MNASAFLNLLTLDGLIPEPMQMGKHDGAEIDVKLIATFSAMANKRYKS